MKNFIKNNSKLIFIGLIISFVCLCGAITATAAIIINARDVSFTSTNASFKSNNVESAIDELYDEAQKEQKYSLEEKVVGAWIDGKPIYRKTVVVDYALKNWESIFDVSSFNIDNFVSLKYILNHENLDYSFEGPYFYSTSNDIFIYYSSGSIKAWINDKTYLGGKFYITIEYTKTTD